MITGQSKDTPLPSIRAEAGVSSYSTIRRCNILTARERALRTSEDHPSSLAIHGEATQRLNIRKGFTVTANQLAEFLPPTAETRKPIDLYCDITMGRP
jgi:hypothetical protein